VVHVHIDEAWLLPVRNSLVWLAHPERVRLVARRRHLAPLFKPRDLRDTDAANECLLDEEGVLFGEVILVSLLFQDVSEQLGAFVVLGLGGDYAYVRLIINDVGLDNVNDLECVWRVEVGLPLDLGWFEYGVVAVVTLLVELAVLPVLLVTGGPAFLEACEEFLLVGCFNHQVIV
jgi:hypothetical protein